MTTVAEPLAYLELKPRLRQIDLRPLGDDQTLVITPSGDMFEVACPPQELSALLQACDGERTLGEVLGDSPKAADFAEVVAYLVETGAMSTDAVEPNPLADTRLVLYADQGLATTIQQLKLTDSFGDLRILDQTPDADMDLGDMVVVILRDFDRDLFMSVDAVCRERNLPWAALYLENGVAWLGPVIVPGRTADYEDLVDRRMCCSDNEEMFAAEMAKPIYPKGEPTMPNAADLAWILGRFFAEIEDYCTHGACNLLSTELKLDPRGHQEEKFSFLPMPHRRLTGSFMTSAKTVPELMINYRSGAIVRGVPVEHHPSVPATLITKQAHVSNIARKYPCANDVIVGGSNFGDGESAYYASIGEAVERYCGNYIPGEHTRRATYNELKAAGEHAIDPDSLVLFDDALYDAPGCPIVRFTRDLPVMWVEGRSLTRNCPAWLPVSLTYVNWHTGLKGEPITNYYWFPGIAAGINLDHAITSGLEEIVERDITMIWWMNRQALPSMIHTPELEAIWDERSRAAGQRPWLINLDNEFDIPVMAGILENTKDGYFNIGFGCRPDPVEAARKAWTEALTLQEGSRDMDDPNGLLRTSVEEWGLIDVPYKPWRKDRRYLDDYRPDFRDVSDLLQQQQVNLDPRCLERVRHWVDTPRTRTFDSVPGLKDRSLATIQERIESRGYEIFYKDITTADVDLTGLKAARIIVPGLAPNTSAAFPPLGRDRILSLPVKMGWRDQPLTKEDLNYAPLPHA